MRNLIALFALSLVTATASANDPAPKADKAAKPELVAGRTWDAEAGGWLP